MNKVFYRIVSFIVLTMSLVACDEDRLGAPSDIGNGDAVLTAEVTFSSLAPALSRSNVSGGTPGNAIRDINTLCIVLYAQDGTFVRKYFFDTSDPEMIVTDSKDNPSDTPSPTDPLTGHRAEETTKKATVKLGKVPYGRYRMYAIANVAEDLLTDKLLASAEDLKSLSFAWNEDDIAANCQMFGYFSHDNKSEGFDAPLVTVAQPVMTLHAWVKRSVSKITVAFDGRNLKPGVEIFIRSVEIKDIPAECYLGAVNPAEPEKAISLIKKGQILSYSEPEDFSTASAGYLSADRPINGYDQAIVNNTSLSADEKIKALHSETTQALYMFENMQGEGVANTPSDKRQQVEPSHSGPSYPGGVDPSNIAWKDTKRYGTYIEVKAFYRSNNETEGRGEVLYRFMLGKDTYLDYNAERNYHYKLTLRFKGWANDVDWHIDYLQQYLKVAEPKRFNYQGKVFKRDNSLPNFGHTFSDENDIIVTSYVKRNGNTYNDVKVTYEGSDGVYRDECDWLELIDENPPEEPGLENIQRRFRFRVKPSPAPAQERPLKFKIDDKLNAAPQNGTADQPFNLADPSQGQVAPVSAAIKNTANCYMIGAKGYYLLPLVYGNAITDGNQDARTYTGSGTDESDDMLGMFKNHLGNDISSAYIRKNPGCVPEKAVLVWQDEANLVCHTDLNGNDIEFVPNAYPLADGTYAGGIKFSVGINSTIQQGNAMIAIKDTEDRVMWSWHIWVSRFDFENTIRVTNYLAAENEIRQFDLMPVNLGWCSKHEEEIIYYEGRSCNVKFTSGELSEIVEIIQEPHVAFTLGNNPYYQWGRKDPFFGTNDNWGNKAIYTPGWFWGPPKRLYDDWNSDDKLTEGVYPGAERKDTREILGLLIQHPDVWHNPPGKYPISYNKTFANLWGGGMTDGPTYNKTVYDPCPVGYYVSHYKPFATFTVTGNDTSVGDEWFDVRTDNVVHYKDNLYEFYTDTCKVRSIIFPESGYRDWDSQAGVYFYGTNGNGIGYAWTRQISDVAYVEGGPSDRAFNLEFSRKEQNGFIRPQNIFYTCDGFPVRPCLIPQDITE